MTAITKQTATQFRIQFREIGASGLKKLLGGGFFQVDPFLIARAIVQVMRQASMRSAAGRLLVWNDYRVILAGEDFEPLRSLQARLQKDIGTVLEEEAKRLRAELVGDLFVSLIADEANDLQSGEGVIRVDFVANDRIAAPQPGQMTIRLDCAAISGELRVPAGGSHEPAPESQTVHVDDPTLRQVFGYVLSWPGGSAAVAQGIRTIVGREHPSPPPHFIALAGASQRINKEQFWLFARPMSCVVGRLPGGNPVAVDGNLIRAAEEVEIAQSEFQIDLSRGDLVLTMVRTTG